METIGRIRREHRVKGKSIKEIARDLKIARNTVRKVLRSDATSFEYERERQPQPKLGPWRAELDRLLAANEGKRSVRGACRWSSFRAKIGHGSDNDGSVHYRLGGH